MTGPVRGSGKSANDRHFDRLYKRLDELSSRVSRLERAMWVASGSLGSVALFNLYSNLTQGG